MTKRVKILDVQILQTIQCNYGTSVAFFVQPFRFLIEKLNVQYGAEAIIQITITFSLLSHMSKSGSHRMLKKKIVLRNLLNISLNVYIYSASSPPYFTMF